MELISVKSLIKTTRKKKRMMMDKGKREVIGNKARSFQECV